jgi:lipopolysaccharide transport system permease protein
MHTDSVVIKPRKKLSISWKELKAYRELFFYFAWRDVKVRYKQTVIGATWVILQPVSQMVVFTVFFNKVAGIQSGNNTVPYAIFSYTGLLFWNLFSGNLTRISNSMVDNQGVITKIYFPRVILPFSSIIVGLIDFFFAFLVFVGLMIFYKFPPTWEAVALLIPAIIVTCLSALGIGMFFAALNVKYRDVRQIVPFLLQIGLFITPVIYPVNSIPERFQWILYLNPMTAVVNAMRSSFLKASPINWPLTWLSIVVCLVLLVVGFVYFKSTEREFADII